MTRLPHLQKRSLLMLGLTCILFASCSAGNNSTSPTDTTKTAVSDHYFQLAVQKNNTEPMGTGSGALVVAILPDKTTDPVFQTIQVKVSGLPADLKELAVLSLDPSINAQVGKVVGGIAHVLITVNDVSFEKGIAIPSAGMSLFRLSAKDPAEVVLDAKSLKLEGTLVEGTSRKHLFLP
jgi:hypothetical protein